MKVVFVYMGTINLGIESLAGMLEAHGHKTDLIYDPALFDDKRYIYSPRLARLFNQEKIIIEKILESRPDLIAFSVLTYNYQWASRMAQGLKKKLPQVPIVFGGHHPTLLPERVIKDDFVDFLVVGEGEYALLDLANALEKGGDCHNIENVWSKKDGKIISNPVRKLIEDLDVIPLPDKELFQKYIPSQDEYIIISGRGCPFRCTFCCNPVWHKIYEGKGRFVRKRSVANVIEELKVNKKKYGFKTIYFADEAFTWNSEWIRQFAESYGKQIQVPFKCVCHPLQLDEEIVGLLKKAGCYAVEIGIQTIDEELKRSLLRRTESNTEVKEAIERCHKYGLTIIADHIFGLPGDKEEFLEKAACFYSQVRPHRITDYTLSYSPETALLETACKMGIVDAEQLECIESGRDNSYIHGGSTKDKHQKRIAENFIVFFKLIPFIPDKLVILIIKKKTYRYFHLFPKPFLAILDLLTVIFISHEYRALNYLKYYYRELKKYFKLKFRFKRGSNVQKSKLKPGHAGV
ncbi:MAG: radical SAM protein [bacterium]|nr:radical SAM protein [bacterium]